MYQIAKGGLMIIVLTGPSGVGKTDVSWALLEQFENMVFLDCDWFASRVPFSWKKEADVKSVFQAISLMIEFHLNRGDKNFVIPITLEMAMHYQKYEHFFTKWKSPVRAFRLRCSNQELIKRIHDRDRIDSQKEQELAGMIQAQKTFDTLFAEDFLFHMINTTKLTEQKVAQQLYELTKR